MPDTIQPAPGPVGVDERWCVGRRVSLVTLIGFLAQVCLSVWFIAEYKATTDARIDGLERTQMEQARLVADNRRIQSEARDRLAARVDAQAETMNEIRTGLAGLSAQMAYAVRSLERLADQREQDRRGAR